MKELDDLERSVLWLIAREKRLTEMLGECLSLMEGEWEYGDTTGLLFIKRIKEALGAGNGREDTPDARTTVDRSSVAGTPDVKPRGRVYCPAENNDPKRGDW